MTHVLLLVHPRADNAGCYCAASVLLRTRFLVSNLGEVVHGPNRSATVCIQITITIQLFQITIIILQITQQKTEPVSTSDQLKSETNHFINNSINDGDLPKLSQSDLDTCITTRWRSDSMFIFL